MGGALTLERLAPRAGLIGAAAIAICAVLAGIAYRGVDGEAYSPLNHYVSELGELGVSSLAVIFNSGLIVGGLCFAAFMIGLGQMRGGAGGVAYAILGAVAGLAGAGVGLFPVNTLDRHLLATFFFFNLGWIAIVLASVDFIVRPDGRFAPWLSVLGLVVVAAFIGFIWAYAASSNTSRGGVAPTTSVRPSLDAVTVFEWLAIAGILGWTFAVSWAWERARGTVRT